MFSCFIVLKPIRMFTYRGHIIAYRSTKCPSILVVLPSLGRVRPSSCTPKRSNGADLIALPVGIRSIAEYRYLPRGCSDWGGGASREVATHQADVGALRDASASKARTASQLLATAHAFFPMRCQTPYLREMAPSFSYRK